MPQSTALNCLRFSELNFKIKQKSNQLSCLSLKLNKINSTHYNTEASLLFFKQLMMYSNAKIHEIVISRSLADIFGKTAKSYRLK